VFGERTLSYIGRAKPSRDFQRIDSIETSAYNLTNHIEDIAMTSLITILALSAAGLGHHDGGYASAQCPSKALPCAQAPSKCPPVPSKCPPAPSKCLPAPQKACPQACPPSKAMPCAQAPSKGYPAPYTHGSLQAPIKAAPQY